MEILAVELARRLGVSHTLVYRKAKELNRGRVNHDGYTVFDKDDFEFFYNLFVTHRGRRPPKLSKLDIALKSLTATDILELSDKSRLAVKMRLGSGYDSVKTYSEIGQVLSISTQGAQALVQRAVDHINLIKSTDLKLKLVDLKMISMVPDEMCRTAMRLRKMKTRPTYVEIGKKLLVSDGVALRYVCKGLLLLGISVYGSFY